MTTSDAVLGQCLPTPVIPACKTAACASPAVRQVSVARQGARVGFMTSISRRARLRLAADARHAPVFAHADLTDVGALDARAGTA